MSPLNQEIDRQAADWAARRDLQTLSSEEGREFASWLAADIRHLGAYGRAEAVLARLERLHRAAVIDSAPDIAGAPSWTMRGIVRAGSVAAGFAVLGAVGRVAWESVHAKKAHPAEQHPEEHF